ncbi:MAG: sulfatase family protein, partial [Anaerolineae bacterium]
DDWEGPHFTWPNYGACDVEGDALRHIRRQYAACLTMADRWFGRLLDELERQGCMEDTLILLTTDHGHLLGEHGYLAKNLMHSYDELALIPLLVHLPGDAHAGETRTQVTQNIDLAPTLLEHFGLSWEHPIHGESWWPCLRDAAAPGQDYALYGWHGSTVNVTDGRTTYLRAPVPSNEPLFHYGCMPGGYDHYWPRSSFASIDAGRFLPYTDMPVFRLPVHQPTRSFVSETLLFDRETDPKQEHNLAGSAIEARMIALLKRAMRASDAPAEQFERLGLT